VKVDMPHMRGKALPMKARRRSRAVDGEPDQTVSSEASTSVMAFMGVLGSLGASREAGKFGVGAREIPDGADRFI
jgi:hypothetical protein